MQEAWDNSTMKLIFFFKLQNVILEVIRIKYINEYLIDCGNELANR